MHFNIVTLFPEFFTSPLNAALMGRARDAGLISFAFFNPRAWALDTHHSVDDRPYGGGPGMVMVLEPLLRCLRGIEKPGRILVPSPGARPFTQSRARELAAEESMTILCGRYEGVDQRIIDTYIDDEVSVGDYVLSSGEVAALVLIDATFRLIEQVITPASLLEESFEKGLLEYPQYTRPEIYDNLKVPEVLLSGHHENIRRWRLEKRVEKTLALRPDLIRLGEEQMLFDEETRKIIDQKRLIACGASGETRGTNERDKGN